MPRKVPEIQDQITGYINEAQELSALEVLTPGEAAQEQPTSTSRVSQWRKSVYGFALAAHFLETLWEEFERRIRLLIASQRVHTISWYQEQILRYQHGAPTDALGYYDNTNRTVAEVEAMKVFKYAAITRTVQNGAIILRAKTAQVDSNGNLVANTSQHIAAGQSFITENSDAGTIVNITTGDGDDLKLEIDIYFDPQILDSDGRRVDGENDTPVIDATREFLKSLEFNDRYIIAKHENAIEAVEGVNFQSVKLAASKYAFHSYDSVGIPNAGVIPQTRVADAGYFTLDMDALVINYIPDE